MKFFYADSLDLVDPEFDFIAEKSRREGRVPQRHDVYAHELMQPRPYDGLLVSKSLFRQSTGNSDGGKYSVAQRARFLREGAARFLRFPPDGVENPESFPILGDCGAFAYKDEWEPPFTVPQIVEFYAEGRFTHGISPDHLILAYDLQMDAAPTQWSLPTSATDLEARIREAHRRLDITMTNARAFLAESKPLGAFEPLGAAQGWSPSSYRKSVRDLVRMGYEYIAIGGLVPLKTPDIRSILEEVRLELKGNTRLHLLGVTRLSEFSCFASSGVVSFDSSSPVIQAFMDARDNYYSTSADGHYTAVRIPQSDGPRMLRMIREGSVQQEVVLRLEREALRALREYDGGRLTLDSALDAVRAYDAVSAGKTQTRWDRVRRSLEDQPWKSCDCSVCTTLGIEVMIFRGANRNRRRGFHNLAWTHRRLQDLRGGL
jgi:hypothetical protein